jgi:uncharacterized protein
MTLLVLDGSQGEGGGQILRSALALSLLTGTPFQIPDLIARKTAQSEQSVLPESDLELHEREYHRLVDLLESSAGSSSLPEAPTSRPALHDLLVRLRLHGLD